MSSKKEDDERRERTKKRSDQRSRARTSKWREKLFIHQRISSRTACFSQYLRDEDKVMQRRHEVTRTREARISIQLLNTISHDWEKSYSLSHCWRWRTRRVYLLFSIVIWAYDALNPFDDDPSWHDDSPYASRSIRHIDRTSTRRSRARYFLWHES